MAHKELLSLLVTQCKDMGLSDVSIEEIAGIASKRLTDKSTDEDIKNLADEFIPIFKTMQGEATRWAQKKKPNPKPDEDEQKPDDKKNKPDDKKTDDFKSELEEFKKLMLEQVKTQGETIATLNKKLSDSQRLNVIAGEMSKLGLNEKDMEFVTVPEDADITAFLGKYKQSLVDRGLKPIDVNVSKEAKDKANNELAETMLKEFSIENKQ